MDTELKPLIVIGRLQSHADTWAHANILRPAFRPITCSFEMSYRVCAGLRGKTIIFVDALPGNEFVALHAPRNNIISVKG